MITKYTKILALAMAFIAGLHAEFTEAERIEYHVIAEPFTCELELMNYHELKRMIELLADQPHRAEEREQLQTQLKDLTVILTRNECFKGAKDE